MDLLTLGQYAAALTAIGGAVFGAYRLFVRAVSSVVEPHFQRILGAQNEQDDDHASVFAQVTSRLDAIEECLSDVKSQVMPNGGGSLRDRVDELYEMVRLS